MKRGLPMLLGLTLTLALTACASATHLPYRSWFLSFSGVPYMEVWVENARITDVTGHRRPWGQARLCYIHAGSGLSAFGTLMV